MSRSLSLPLDADAARGLRAGDELLLSGTLLTGRDQACRRLHEAAAAGQRPPVDLAGQLIYFVGPSPARPGAVIGSAGPTTSGRMNAFMPGLLAAGVRGFLGKGSLAPAAKAALVEHGGVYLGAIGGTGALLARAITACEVVAYPELLSEAVHRMTFHDFPAIVLNDSVGGDLYARALERP